MPWDDSEHLELARRRHHLVETTRAALYEMLGPDAVKRLELPGDEGTIDAELRKHLNAPPASTQPDDGDG